MRTPKIQDRVNAQKAIRCKIFANAMPTTFILNTACYTSHITTELYDKLIAENRINPRPILIYTVKWNYR